MNSDEFLEMIKNEAYEDIYNFLYSFGLNPYAFKHLEEIKYELKEYKKVPASYLPQKNVVQISKKLIDKCCEKYNNKTLSQDIIDAVKEAIVHEILHANRTMLLGNTFSIDSFDDMILNEKNKNHDISKYNDYLSEISDFIGLDEFDNIIPIKVTTKKIGVCDVIAYDKARKEYHEYSNINCSELLNIDYKTFLISLSKKLNQIKKYKIINDKVDASFISTPDDFLLNYKIPNIIDIDKLYDELDDKITLQNAIEEAFTELFAKLVTYKTNPNNLSSILDSISRDDDIQEDVKYASRMVEIAKFPIIVWFMTSAYDENYTDKFRELIGKDYDKFLELFASIQKSEFDEEEVNLDDLMELDNILDEVESIKR